MASTTCGLGLFIFQPAIFTLTFRYFEYAIQKNVYPPPFAVVMLAGSVALGFSSQSFAGEGVVSIRVETISIVGRAFGSHKVGNMEIKVVNGFVPPAGVYCDGNHITTLKSADTDRSMFSLLLDARDLGQTVVLRITDNPVYNAFPGRCSIMSVTK